MREIMEINLKAPVTKSQFVARELEQKIVSGKLAPNSRLPGMRAIAKNFSTSLRVVQSAFEILDKKGIVTCKLGSGTFVNSNPGAKKNIENNTIYFLIPHPIHNTLQLESSLIKRRMVYGASQSKEKNLIQPIAVSRDLNEKLENIDWDIVEQIPEGANVFVYGFWFKKLFPFLLKKHTKVIIRSNQYQDIKYPEYVKYIQEGNWHKFTIDRIAAMEQAMQYMHNLGYRRTGIIKAYKNEQLHPYRTGMISGCENCGISFNESLYHEVAIDEHTSLTNDIVEFWEKTKFDSLIIGNGNMTKTIYDALKSRLGLHVPEDVALISFTDNANYLENEVPISAIDFSWVSMGREMVKCFNSDKFISGQTIFQASIIERESTRKGAGAFINHNFLPELPNMAHNHILYQMEA